METTNARHSPAPEEAKPTIAFGSEWWAGAEPEVTPTPTFPSEVPPVPEIPPEAPPQPEIPPEAPPAPDIPPDAPTEPEIPPDVPPVPEIPPEAPPVRDGGAGSRGFARFIPWLGELTI